LIPFSQLPAVKKGIKNGAARKFFDPSYFVMALVTAWMDQNTNINTNLTIQAVLLLMIMASLLRSSIIK